jgi:energy-coupling factor transporter transmembrane protein EcfT
LQLIIILYILTALFASIAVAYFQYLYKVKTKAKRNTLLFILKSISLFLLFLLLINPKITTTTFENSKPTLSILVDNSKSISFFNEEQNVIDFISKLKNNKNLSAKFNFEDFIFSTALAVSDSLSFEGKSTNIQKAISDLNNLNTGKNAPILLLTDGNQTIGSAYEYTNATQTIYPIVFGDTVNYKDLKVSQVNVNKYSYIKNKFPVEVLLNYDGDENVKTKFVIFNGDKKVFSKNLQFSKSNNSQIITTNLTALKEGNNYYTATIQKIKGEKNTYNNTKNFSVEVIDEQTKILLLTSVLHPDIGAIKKAIESNKQRSLDISVVNEFKGELSDFQLIILYQPNSLFQPVFNKIKQFNLNSLVVTGEDSDWSFINKQQIGFTKKASNETENYGAVYNPSFLTFLQKDIGFNEFSLLKDTFGAITFYKEHQDLLLQSINGVELQQPLIAVLEQNKQKMAVIFGEGIWKWRASSFLRSNSFQEFDQFIGSLVQYVSSKKKRDRLVINSENLYPANSIVNISAFYSDKNYQFDERASLEIAITNKESKKLVKLPFSLSNNSYQIAIENLNSGAYIFKVSVVGQDITTSGSFKITAYNMEQQFTNSNVQKLRNLAVKLGGMVFFKDEVASLSKKLLEDKRYYTVQKPSVKEQNLIDWHWFLIFVISLFSVEWFVRKYYGKI